MFVDSDSGSALHNRKKNMQFNVAEHKSVTNQSL